MRIAIQVYGEFRCCKQHDHFKHFMDNFPEIFNENNEIDVFILTSIEHINMDIYNENVKYLQDILGNKLKKIDIFQHYSEEIIDKENELNVAFQNLHPTIQLTDEEMSDYKTSLLEGIELRRKYNLYLPSLTEDLDYISNVKDNCVEISKNKFVSRLYYRRALTNSMRRKYETENNIKYDWVCMVRCFDAEFHKVKICDMFYNLPIVDAADYCVDIFTAGTPEIIDKINDGLGFFPVVGYEQWKDKDFFECYNKFDVGIIYLRRQSTYCFENQLTWQILKESKEHINLRCNEHVIEPDTYFKFSYCNGRR